MFLRYYSPIANAEVQIDFWHDREYLPPKFVGVGDICVNEKIFAICKIVHLVNSRGGSTICSINVGGQNYLGRSICSKEDQFDKSIGRALALTQAVTELHKNIGSFDLLHEIRDRIAARYGVRRYVDTQLKLRRLGYV